MQCLLEKWDAKLESLGLELNQLASTLQKPLRCVWINPDSRLSSHEFGTEHRRALPFIPVVCLSASTVVHANWQYIQGAADDEESWAQGLTHRAFWLHRDRLLEADSTDIDTLVQQVATQTATTPTHHSVSCGVVSWVVADCLGVCSGVDVTAPDAQDLYVFDISTTPPPHSGPHYLHIPVPLVAKLSQGHVSAMLHRVVSVATRCWQHGQPVLVADTSGTGIGVCVCACLCLCLAPDHEPTSIKQRVNRALCRVQTVALLPVPSRRTVKQLTRFLSEGHEEDT